MALVLLGVSGCSTESTPPTIGSAVILATDRDLPVRPQVPLENPLPGKFQRPLASRALSLREAVERAVEYGPAVKAAYTEIGARMADAVQASYKPNPQLSVNVENFGGSQSKAAFDQAETTVGLSQVIELGDKRVKRLAAARLDASLAGWDYEMARVVTASRAADAFVDVLAVKERLAVLQDFARIAEVIRSGVNERVLGGKASAIDLDRAIVGAARAKALVDSEQLKFDAVRAKLATLWGAEKPDFQTASGRLGQNRRVPTLAAVRGLLDSNPQLARWSDELSRRAAALSLERSKGVPDLTVGAGVRQLNDDNATALVASVSVPLKVFDGNQGAIAAAERRAAKANFEADVVRNELVGSLVEVLGELAASNARVTAFESKVLPAAQSAFDRTRIGYDEGKFDFLNVLDTQRALFEARLELVNARAEYEKARVKVETLIGRDLATFDESAHPAPKTGGR